MKIVINILLFVFIPLCTVVGQSNIRFNNYWDNVYTINPASINDAYSGSVSMGVRKQWTSFEGAPTTMAATGKIYLDRISTQLGAKIFVEQKGYTSLLDMDFSYANSFYLNNTWKLNLGLDVSYQNLSYDISKITFAEEENPDIYDRLLSSNNMNADLGVEINSPNWKIGASSHNFVSVFMPENDLHLNTNILYAMYRQNSNDFVNYGFGTTGFQYGNIYQMELSISAFIKKNYDSHPFQIGAFYRTWRELGLIFGVEFDKFKVSYSCDFNFGKVMYHSLGTHEVVLTYNFDKIYHCRSCW